MFTTFKIRPQGKYRPQPASVAAWAGGTVLILLILVTSPACNNFLDNFVPPGPTPPPPGLIATWVRNYGSHDGHIIPAEVRATGDGGLVMVGAIERPDGDRDVWVCRTDYAGQVLWSRTYGYQPFHLTRVNAVAQTSDGGYIAVGAVETQQEGVDMGVAKLDARGRVQWGRTFGDPGVNRPDEALAVTCLDEDMDGAADDGFLVAGFSHFKGSIRAYAFKLAADGQQDPDFYVISGEQGAFRAVQQTSDGGFALAGESLKYYGDGSTQREPLLVVGSRPAVGSEVWIVGYSPDGEDGVFYGIEETDGRLVLAGSTINTDRPAAFVVKLTPRLVWPEPSISGQGMGEGFDADSAGVIEWEFFDDTASAVQARAILQMPDKALVVAGGIGDCKDSSCTESLGLTRLAPDGALLERRTIGELGMARSMTLAPDGTFLAAGSPQWDAGLSRTRSGGWWARVNGNLQVLSKGGVNPFESPHSTVRSALSVGSGKVVLAGSNSESPVRSCPDTRPAWPNRFSCESGSFPSIGWVMSTDAEAGIEWVASTGKSMEEGLSIDETADGEFVIGASMHGVMDEWSQKREPWLLRLNSSGDVLWQKRFSFAEDADFAVVREGASGLIAVIHGGHDSTVLRLDKGGVVHWVRTLPGVAVTSLETLTDDGFCLAGVSQADNLLWAAEYGNDGVAIWQTAYYGDLRIPADRRADARIATAPDGFFIWRQSSDIVIRLRRDGTVERDTFLAGVRLNAVGALHDGGCIVAGDSQRQFCPDGQDCSDIWAARLSREGQAIWQKTYATGGADHAVSVDAFTEAGVVVLGSSNGFSQSGFGDAWLLRMDGDGAIASECPSGIGVGVSHNVQHVGTGSIQAGVMWEFGLPRSEWPTTILAMPLDQVVGRSCYELRELPDRDGDGVSDELDQCPDDAGKSEPGLCGCGRSDTDSDADGVADCAQESPAPLPGPSTVVISDSDFNSQNWAAVVQVLQGSPASQITDPPPQTGGVADSPWREMFHIFPGGQNQQFLIVDHFYVGRTYDPSTEGAIQSIDYSESRIQLNPPSWNAEVAARLAIRQMNAQTGIETTYYAWGSGPDTFKAHNNWELKQLTNLSASDFTPSGLDFSASGGRLTFGYYRANSSGNGVYTIHHGIDDWTVTIHKAP